MKIKFHGEMTIPQLRQAIFEQLLEMEDRFLVRHSKDITLYLTPTNGFGHEVSCLDTNGRVVKQLLSEGPYRSAADEFDIS